MSAVWSLFHGQNSGTLRWSLPFALYLLVAWTISALLFSVTMYSSMITEGRPIPLSSAATWHFLSSYIWCVLSIPIFFLEQKYPIPGSRPFRNVAVHIAAASCLTAANFLILIPADEWLDPYFHLRFHSIASAYGSAWSYRLLSGVVTYGLVLLAFSSMNYYWRMRAEERRSGELKLQLAQAELQALRMQIQPHFLFNTLHSVSALIYESPPEALAMVSRLGNFLRTTLERSASQTIRLEDELKFAELYLDIEQVRFGERLRVAFDIAPETLGAEVPSLILQPLLENALRHGVGRALGPVELVIAAVRKKSFLEITLRNTDLGPNAGAQTAPASQGIGLANTRSRLNALYGKDSSLTSGSPSPGSFCVSLRIPSREDDDGPVSEIGRR